MTCYIEGGYILISRKLLKSGIVEKPPLFLKLWIWMLVMASHKNHGELKRGQFFTSLQRMRDAMKYKVGYRVMKPTLKEIRTVTKFLTKAHMIVTTKVTHGLLITIIKYDDFQNPKNYEGHNEGQSTGQTRGKILTRMDNKKGITPEIFSLRERYLDQKLIDQVFEAIRSTRKSGKVANSVLLAQLQKWEKYPVEQVEAGLRVYLGKDYASKGKREDYLLGIIRNQKVGDLKQQSTGSPLLDLYYAARESH